MLISFTFRFIAQIFCALCFFIAHFAAHGQSDEFAKKPILVISGPGPDTAIRILAGELTPVWNQQIVAQTIAAASGKIASETVLRSKPDGNTLLSATSSLELAHHLGVNTVDVVNQLTPVAMISELPFILVVPSSKKWHSMQELVAFAKSNPGVLNYASGGNGTLPHLAGELLKQKAKIDITHIPFKAADQAATALLGGEVDMMFTSYPVVRGLVESGQLRVLAISSSKRSALLNQIPTLIELGFDNFNFLSWTCLFAPEGMPVERLNKIRKDINFALSKSSIKQQFLNLGFEPTPSELTDSQELTRYLKLDAIRLSEMLRQSGTKID
jgi:tripartite-type tricarboxylate transporter receptor subunit TctC